MNLNKIDGVGACQGMIKDRSRVDTNSVQLRRYASGISFSVILTGWPGPTIPRVISAH